MEFTERPVQMTPTGSRRAMLSELATELIENILLFLYNVRDRTNLCSVSRYVRQCSLPIVYRSWEFHGYEHSTESLYLFLRSVIANPDLANNVKTLDIREWGWCPRVEDWVGENTGRIQPAFGSILEMEDLCGSENSDPDYEDSDQDPDDDLESPSESDYSNGIESISEDEVQALSTSTFESELGSYVSYDGYCGDFITIRAVHNLDLSQGWTERFKEAISNRHRDERHEDTLLALLLINLPGLEVLYAKLPDDRGRIPEMLRSVVELDRKDILSQLTTAFLTAALRIGSKDHREYFLWAEEIVSFLSLPSLRSLSVQTVTDMGGWQYPDGAFAGLAGLSNITSLECSESELDPDSLLKLITVPKTLQRFHWSQDLSNYNYVMCVYPYNTFVGEKLRLHQQTLQELDINLRYWTPDHEVPNRYRPSKSFVARSSNKYITKPDHADTRKEPLHLIGDLKEFCSLKSLSIDFMALCGDSYWGFSPSKLADILPPQLEILRLRVPPRKIEAGYPREQELGRWVDELSSLARESRELFPALQRIYISTSVAFWSSKDNQLLEPVVEACQERNIAFELQEEPLVLSSPIGYFKDSSKYRNPGRDH